MRYFVLRFGLFLLGLLLCLHSPAQSHPYTATTNTSLIQPQILIGPWGTSDTIGEPKSLFLIDTGTNTELARITTVTNCTPGPPAWQCGLWQPFARISTGGYTAFQEQRPSGYEVLILDDQLQIRDSVAGVIGTMDNHECRIYEGEIYTIFLDTTTVLGVEHMGVQVQDSLSKMLTASWGTYTIPTICADTLFPTMNGNYYHLNSAWPFDWNGQPWLLISARNLSSLILLNRTTGSYWLIGGTCSDFAVTGAFRAQHDATVLSTSTNGLTFSLFNNGVDRGYSSGAVYALDTVNMTCQRTLELVHPDSIYAVFMGSFEIIDGGYVVGWGGNTTRHDPAVTLFDTTGAILWELKFDSMGTYSYRAVVGPVNILTALETAGQEATTYDYHYLLGPKAGTQVVGPPPRGELLLRREWPSGTLRKVILRTP